MIRQVVTGVLVGALVLAVSSGDVSAQNRYSTWGNPDSSKTSESGLAAELRRLIDEAEKSRAADPVFLRDLRGLLGKYDRAAAPSAAPRTRPTTSQPVMQTVFSDEFRDGDFAHNPTWTVDAGRYWVEAGYGLRSAVDASQAPAQTSGRSSKEDLAAAVVGSILNRAFGGKTTTSTSAPAEAPAAHAAIHTVSKISNAFVIRLDMSSWKGAGELAFGPYQGRTMGDGYRLIYRPGGSALLELMYVSAGRSQRLGASAQPVRLEDNKSHAIEWRRDAIGAMTVSIDGQASIRATHRGAANGFDGFVMDNRGGDYIVARIGIDGTR